MNTVTMRFLFILLTTCSAWVSFGANAANTLEVKAAWYGTDAGESDNSKRAWTIGNVEVAQRLRGAVQNGVLMVPGNMNDFFKGDPFPGVKKRLAVYVVYNGVAFDLRQEEGKALIFPGTLGETYGRVPPAGGNIEIMSAGYAKEPVTRIPLPNGREILTGGYVSGSINSSPDFTEKVRQNGKLFGNIYIPADMNKFFGRDPNPGIRKMLSLWIRYQGREYNLIQKEGKALAFPGVEGTDYVDATIASDDAIKPYFDVVFYFKKNPDLQNAFGYNPGELWSHYLRDGIHEGRDPSPTISIPAMRTRYPWLKEMFGDNYKQYMMSYVNAGGPKGIYKDVDATQKQFIDKGIYADPRLAYFDAEFYFRNFGQAGSYGGDNKSCEREVVRYMFMIPKGSTARCAGRMDVPALTDVSLDMPGMPTNRIPMGPPQSAAGKDVMRVGDWLGVNEFLISRSQNKVAVQQSNGDFAVYNTGDGNSRSSGNFAGLHTNFTGPEGQYFTVMQGDGQLCTYKGTKPSDNKGFVGCLPGPQTKGDYYLHLQSDNNLVIRVGKHTFDNRGHIYDFRTNQPKSGNWYDPVLNAINSAVKTIAQCY